LTPAGHISWGGRAFRAPGVRRGGDLRVPRVPIPGHRVVVRSQNAARPVPVPARRSWRRPS